VGETGLKAPLTGKLAAQTILVNNWFFLNRFTALITRTLIIA